MDLRHRASCKGSESGERQLAESLYNGAGLSDVSSGNAAHFKTPIPSLAVQLTLWHQNRAVKNMLPVLVMLLFC